MTEFLPACTGPCLVKDSLQVNRSGDERGKSLDQLHEQNGASDGKGLKVACD